MSQNWLIDPATGDYVLSGGAPSQTDSLKVPAYFRMKAKRGTWLYAPDSKWGSDFYTLPRRPSDNGNQKIENVALSALEPILNDGRAKSIEANITENKRGATALETIIIDASGEVVTETFKGLGF